MLPQFLCCKEVRSRLHDVLRICTGLSSQKLHMPACLECVPSGTAGLSDTYCNHVPVNANGWIETLGPGALISRMAPPVPDFLAPFRLAALSTRGSHCSPLCLHAHPLECWPACPHAHCLTWASEDALVISMQVIRGVGV
jgi:hypothetical protein